ncbi:DNA (cytosine-5-)-methyltransferase [archaeon]|nr:DNA (cytosine-5-)-methyltransferase [archaeon]
MNIKIIEMFAGVGGFRIGLENASSIYKSIWSNQWEPGKKKQVAWECYEKNFGENSCLNKNISEVNAKEIPDFDLLTGGFPCQDYSVAKSLKYSGGIEGKKGVLWWDINRVIEGKSPPYILLENVDRLLMSPSKQRGRDFAIILSCLMNLGYSVEWRIVNAANFGMPQKRKRVFIFATKKSDFFTVLKETFPGKEMKKNSFKISNDTVEVSNEFGKNLDNTFLNYGTAIDFNVETSKVTDIYDGEYTYLGDILEEDKNIDDKFFISAKELELWKPFKLGRKLERISKEGHHYIYSEGKMTFPDALDKPARTIITGEGGQAASRFKHVIFKNGKYRRLTPLELERAQMFPDNHTKGYTDVQRAFLMGNALVTGVITKIGKTLEEKINEIKVLKNYKKSK